MKLTDLHPEVDAHTHTVLSGHAWSTLRENCQSAHERGLKALCMTDHGPAMQGSSMIWAPYSFKQLPPVIEGVRVYAGVELNICGPGADLDHYPVSALSCLQFGIASMHMHVSPISTPEAHTQNYLDALTCPQVDLIGHPGTPQFPIEAERLVKAVRDANRMIEINNNSFAARSGSYENCLQIARLCKRFDVRICVDSDAHYCGVIGHVPRALELLAEIDFPQELIVNLTFERFESYMQERQARLKAQG